ncbi:MAG: DUF3987 domain-containing protein [bacterium]
MNKTSTHAKTLLELLERNSIKDELKSLLSMRPNKYEWRGIMAVPPGSILSNTVAIFKKETDIPLEIPFFTVLSFISAYLTKKQVKIISHMGNIRPDIWTIILAPSGSSKSTAINNLRDTVGKDVTLIPKSASAAQFVLDLNNYNNGLLIRDEFAQHLWNIKVQTYLTEQKEYYLLAYDGSPIERRTKSDKTTVLNPCLSILGFNVDETFSKYLTAEDILDGFAQRFSYIIAKADPTRKTIDYPDYNIEAIKSVFVDSWAEFKTITINPEYTISEKGIKVFRDGFRELYKIEIPNSYYRRALFKSIKYALLYHVILKKDNSVIDEQDLEWALRVVFLHLRDGKELLSEKDISELEKIVRHAEELHKKFERKGKRLTPRDLIHYNRHITNVGQAKAILEIMQKTRNLSNKKQGIKSTPTSITTKRQDELKLIDGKV